MLQNICIFGDSVSKGVVLDEATQKYVLLKDSFANRIAGSGISVRNFSRFGSTVTRGLDMLEKHRPDLKDYDHVILEYGGNDCDYAWAQVALAPDAVHLPNTPPEDFTEQYAKMIQEVRNSGSRPVILSLPPICAERYFSWVSRGISGANVLHWLGDVERIYRWHELYNLAIIRLAGATHTPLVDITAPFLKIRDYAKLICADGIHPNEAGHELISRTLSDEICRYRESFAS